MQKPFVRMVKCVTDAEAVVAAGLHARVCHAGHDEEHGRSLHCGESLPSPRTAGIGVSPGLGAAILFGLLNHSAEAFAQVDVSTSSESRSSVGSGPMTVP